MIGPFVEGVQQSILPCSWVIVVPALLVGLASRNWRMPAAFAATVVFAAWSSVSGWVNPPIWVAGASLLIGGILIWRYRAGAFASIALGLGVAWAWAPCVGEELAAVLNTAQQDPLGAFPGMAGFMLALVSVGLILGILVGWMVRRLGEKDPERVVASALGALGVLMILGLYTPVASVFARWSTEIWS